jgi:dihydroorotase
MATYDLLIRGGTVIDPAAGINERRDVAISGGKVAAVEASIGADQAERTLDAAGKLVVPGLIDLHAHLFAGVGGGAEVDRDCLGRGTTTVLDGGSTGSAAYEGFRRYVVEPSKTRVLTWLHISSIGLIDTRVGELTNLLHVDPDGAAAMASAHRDNIIGFKIRVSAYVAGGTAKPALRLIRQAADATGLPIMVHIGEGGEPLNEVLTFLRPGDVVTHTLTGRRHGILGYDGKVLPAVREARQNGIHFDSAHGRGHWGFELIRKVLDQGFVPDSLSTDITAPTAADPQFHLPTIMSKMMALGLPLEQAIPMATSNSARWLKREAELGTLQPGAAGDVAILERLEGDFTLRDNEGQSLQARERLRPVATVLGGQVFEASADS